MESGVEVLHYLKHYEEEAGDQTESKVSKIATMFRVPGDSEERDGVHGGGGPQVTVVRTESHVARFNTARALFEKMAEKNGAPEQRQPQRHPGSFAKAVTPPGMGRGGVSPNIGVSLSRSPSPGAMKTGVYSNGHSPAPPYKTGGAVTPQGSSYIATITSMSSSTPGATPPFYASPPSVLQLSSKKTVDPNEVTKGRWPSAAQLPQKGVEGPTTRAETTSGRPRPDEALQVEIRLRPEFDPKHHLKNGVAGPDLVGGKDVMSSSKPDLLAKCEPRGRHEHVPGKPLKPAKPETLIDRPLSSHLQNQKIIQRHRNWFQSYSKAKAPLSPPIRAQHPPLSPTSHPQAVSEPRFPVELEKSSSYDNIGQVNRYRRFPVSDDELSPTKNIRSFAKEIQIHKKATDETSSRHGDWRKERAVILSGRSPRECVEEKRGKGAPPEGPKLKTFEEVPTLPSCWSPPKQYNQSAGALTDPSTGRAPGESEDRKQDDVPRRLGVSPEVQRDLSSVCRGLRRGAADDAGETPGRRSFSEGVAIEEGPPPQDAPLVGGEVIWKLRDDLPGEREKRLRDWERKRGLMEEVGVHSALPGEDTSRRASLPSSDAGRRTSWREDRRRAESRLLQRERSPQEKQPRSEEVRRRRLDEPSFDRAAAKRELEFFDTTTRRRDEDEEWERRRKEEKMRRRKEEEEESVAKMREMKRREEYEWRRKEKEDQERARRKEELEKKKEAESGRSRREKEESERRRREEEIERKMREIELEMRRKEEELKRKEELERLKKEEELERRKSEELERRRLEKEELERKKREEEELIRRRREEEVLERRRRKEEELVEKRKREAEGRRKKEEELENNRKKEAAALEKRRNEEEKERESRNREEKEMERRRNEEYERKKRAEVERRKREEEELERKRREEEELERKMREEELERKMREKEMAEMKRKEEEARKREEEKAEIKRREEEALDRKRKEEKVEMKRKEEEALEKKRKEEEAEGRRQKEELEMRRREREETKRKMKEDEEAKRRMKEEEEAKRRMMEELEFERRIREKEEAERKRKEEEELDRRRREEEEAERRRKEEIAERRKKEEAERKRKDEETLKKIMEEKEFTRRRREEEEAARKRKEEEEAEKQRKEVEEAEKRKKDEEAERRRKEEEEAERRRRKKEEEAERRRKEEDEAERSRKEEEEVKRRKEEEAENIRKEGEENENIRKEEEEADNIRKEEEADMRKKVKEAERSRKEEEEAKRRNEEKETDIQQPERPMLKEEEFQKRRRDAEELEDGRETEIKNEEQFERRRELNEESVVESRVKEGGIEPRRCPEEASVMDEGEDARRWREERRRREEEKIKGELERKWQLKKEKLEEEERIRRERDRAQIEKTKRRIAELKKEREMMRRQQAIRLHKLMKAESGEEEEDEEEFPADEEEFTADSQPEESPPPSRPELRESKTVDLLAQDELARVIPFSEFESGAERTSRGVGDPQEGNQSAASVCPRRALGGVEPEDSAEPVISPAVTRQDGDSTRDLKQERSKEAKQDPSKADELLYDHTVLSAQHEIEFCTSPYHGPATKEESCETNSTSSRGDQVFFASTISSEFEPLPPPIPPHNVDPATLASKDHLDNRLPPLPVPESQSVSEPEVMTPEEEEKLLSHNILGSKKRLAEEVEETIEGKPEGAEVSKDEPPQNFEVDPDDVDKDYDSVCVDSPTPDEEPTDLFAHEITEEGFVIRAKEILIEDGVHYFEDGHFWIQVPGLTDDDEDDLPDSVPVHEHTKLKFSTEPIQLFSTFSVTDYDRKNEDVDPVAASAEYELEKRVEKMDVFPVQIEKGECGLGLSIIGMGVGADAGVEKLGIFVKTITPGGATDEDGRIRVNDQIIEVDNQSLVGVTQMFAASVLKNTSGTVNFLIGRETDPENSEVAMLIRQSLLADHERDERRRALEGPNYDPRNAGIFESFSSQSGGDSPSEETPRNLIFSHREEEVIQYGEEFGDAYGSCPPSPIEGVSSPTLEAFNHEVMAKELMQNSDMMILSQHLDEAQQKNEMYEEEINILRCKLAQLEKELGEKVELASSFHETTLKLKDVEDKLQSRQAEIATYQDMLEQSQGQYIILEKKYYKAKKIIKEYQNREKDFLHREEYHITQLEEKDALYNSLVKALKDRVIQLEGDLIKAQQQAGLPIKVPPDLNAQSSNFIHSNAQDNHSPLQKEPPRKPTTISTLDADLSDTEGADTHASEGSKSSTVERKIPSKEELDVAVPPTELLDNSFSKAKGELASRGGLANRQLPSLKKTSSTTSANSFDNDVDEAVDECVPESQQLPPQSSPPKSPSGLLQEEVFHQTLSAPPVTAVSSPATSPSAGSHPPPPSFGSGSPSGANFGGRLPPPYHTPHGQASPAHPHHQPPPYQPPPSAPLSHRAATSPDAHGGRNETPPHRHQPPIARVQPVNRVEASPGPPPHAQHHHQPQQHPQAQQQQTLAHQLKALLAEREASSDPMHRSHRDTSPLKKSPSSLMEDVRQAVIQADMSIGKKPVISGPIHVSSTAQVVSTGQFVHSRTSPQKGPSVATNLQQRIGRDSGSWSSKLSSEVAPSTPSGGVVLLSQRPIDASLPSAQGDENEAAGNRILCTDSSSFDSQHSDKSNSGISARDIISVFDWTKEQVAQWLVVQGLEAYVSTFMSAGITGPRLVNIDTKDLKSLGLSSDDKNKIKRKVKELRQNLEKERKQIEKENKEREKLQKKAEKLAEKAERRKK